MNILEITRSQANPPRLWIRLRKYVRVFRVSLVERMTYRADFLISTFLRFLPMLTTILLWQAVYAGARRFSGRSELSGFSFHDMIAYLLLVNISRMFSSMPGLAAGIARDIRDGSLKKYLLQPIDMIDYLVAYRVAHKVAYIAASFIPYAVLFFLCRGFFVGLVPTDPITWLAYGVSLILAFLVGFAFEACVGMVGFWFLEVTSILYIVMTLNFFVSGHMFPLDLLPPFWAGLLRALPFQYMAYFPAVVFLGKIRGAELAWGLALQGVWAIGFWLLARWLYQIGLRRYSAFGG
ncbi:MAG: ABC transporter permease [Isosphaeraceae bacterium]|jgi:ABC-2 type transport system permease protein|nr:MAG: ABC transporter permease [Isosphaeraceae bacterium]